MDSLELRLARRHRLGGERLRRFGFGGRLRRRAGLALAALWLAAAQGPLQEGSDPALVAAVEALQGARAALASGAGGPEDAGRQLGHALLQLAGRWGEVQPFLEATPDELYREARWAAPADLAPWIGYHHVSHLLASGRSEAALGLAEEVLLAGASGPPGLGLRHLRVELLRSLGRYDDAESALAEFDRFLETAGAGDSLWRARLEGARGQLYQALGLYGLASQAHRVEADEARESGDPQALAANLLNRADLALQRERFSLARRLVQGARELEVIAPTTLDLFEGLALAELEREGGATAAEARAVLQRTLAESPDPWERLTAANALADLELRSGELQAAEQVLGEARAARGLEGFTNREGQAAFLRAQEARLLLARREASPESVGDAYLRASLEALLGEWGALLEAWDRVPARPGGVGFLSHMGRRQVLSTCVRLQLALDGEEGVAGSLALLFEAERRGSVARSLELEEADLARALEAYGRGERALLYYLPSKERSHLFLLADGEAQHFELASRDVLRARVSRLQSLFARAGSSLDRADRRSTARELEAAGRALGEVLLPLQVEKRLSEAKAWTFVGLETLWDPPIEAVVTRDGERLGERFALQAVPSVALGLASRQRVVPRGSDDYWLFANVDPGPAAEASFQGVLPIDLAESAWAELLEPYAKGPARSWCDDELDLSVVREAFEGSARVVQFVTHGVYVDDLERGASLVLSGREEVELLTSAQVDEFSQPLGLVVLTSCSSARGPQRSGDDRLPHLGGAFLEAGARAVVVAKTRVEARAALRLSRVLHAQLLAGEAPAEALRLARSELAQDEDPLAAWEAARYSLIGAGLEPLFEPSLEGAGAGR